MTHADTSGTPIGWLIEALLAAGLDLGSVEGFLEQSLDLQALDRVLLSPARYFEFFEWAARTCNDPDLGVHIAEQLTARDIGLLGYLLENSATLGKWVENFTTYHGIFAQDAVSSVRTEAGMVILAYRPLAKEDLVPLQDTWFSVCLIVRAMRLATKGNWHPLGCRFATPPPDDPGALARVLGTDLHFGQGMNEIEIAETDLRLPVPDADPILYSILKDQADRILVTIGERGELVNRLRMMIVAHLSEGGLDTAKAAAELNMSVRKLHRELDSRGTSFRKLRDSVVSEAARSNLADPRLQITEIAHRLGYSETSAFTRAFRRLEGVTPKEFREQIRDTAN